MKGQSAMEYLSTYGWALLAIIIVAAVFFTYVFPNVQPVSMCNLETGLLCNSYKVSASNASLTLDLAQATGRDILVTQIACTQSPDELQFENLTSQITVPIGSHRQIAGPQSNYVRCKDMHNAYYSPGQEQAFNGRLCLKYAQLPGGEEHAACGRLITVYTYD